MKRRNACAVGFAAAILASCGFHHAKYENPIAKDTQQPDKILFDKAIHDIERGRYEVARLTLNTLINTYDTSEYLAKAKLAIADSWYREGGVQGLTQAEAEYKDFILFYPTMEEAAESQKKLCDIHYKQMDKPDRDPNQALRAEQECKQVLIQYPNSKFVPGAEQELRDIQEVLAEAEMRAGTFYYNKGSWAAAANRLSGLADTYPLYSRADEALWKEADAYSHMGARFRQKSGEALASIVRSYPLSEYADPARKKLAEMEMEVPQPDPAAVARMKYELENRTKPGMLSRATGWLHSAPDTSAAAKAGAPQMNNPKQNIPASVPVPAEAAAGFTGDVTVTPVNGTSALETQPDARSAQPGAQASSSAPATAVAGGATPQAQEDNANAKGKKKPKKNPKKQNNQNNPNGQDSQIPQPPANPPNPTNP
ncbi:MAG TPA: outer membrane protein assembly factor BamD [Bryobacteraceae bacterium]|nr:outer membrane protein assembly factor BamD [Bryobacteraceae bacterium]